MAPRSKVYYMRKSSNLIPLAIGFLLLLPVLLIERSAFYADVTETGVFLALPAAYEVLLLFGAASFISHSDEVFSDEERRSFPILAHGCLVLFGFIFLFGLVDTPHSMPLPVWLTSLTGLLTAYCWLLLQFGSLTTRRQFRQFALWRWLIPASISLVIFLAVYGYTTSRWLPNPIAMLFFTRYLLLLSVRS